MTYTKLKYLIFIMMQSKKTILYIFAALSLTVLLIWFGSAAYSAWQGYTFQKQTDAFQLALSKPYREDTYGGKTPEETWSLFLDALRKDDLELASKYIVPEKRKEKLEFLKREKEIDGLKLLKEQFLVSMQRDVKYSSDETIYFNYITKDNSTGNSYGNSIIFILNPYTKVWKISLL
jgi:hypothetical protein